MKRIVFLVCVTIISVISQNVFGASLLKVGDKAPDFSIQDPNGKTITLSSLKGRIVLLDFWASTCMPCRMAHPDLIQVYNTYKTFGFDIFSISLDTKKEAWVNAIKNDKINWPHHGSELEGWDSKIAASFGVPALPHSFLIDETGTIIAVNLDDYDLDKKLHYLYLEQIHFYPSEAITKIYFTGIAKYQIIDYKGTSVLKGKAIEIDITVLAPGEYTLKYEDKTEKFIKRKNSLPPATFYPSRVEDIITLSRESEYQIYNQRGKLEFKGSGTKIDVTKLPSGVYYLSVEGTISSFFKK
ncbi:MAG: redoxin domain-containing protein [Cytophagales bacterium]|nr:redoxin domain-containing protein [Cytophaga sp.]